MRFHAAACLALVALGCGDASPGAAPSSLSDAGTPAPDAAPEAGASCNDHARNGAETDVDCGYAACHRTCAVGQQCASNRDCPGTRCGDGVCLPASHDDGIRNDGELDVDCGGGGAPACADGKTCVEGARDCVSGFCELVSQSCRTPTPRDGYKNGDETDVDCGGAAGNPRCLAGKVCKADGDCASRGCGAPTSPFAGRCLMAKSCAGGAGADDTCGPKGTDSCCASLPVPGGSYNRYLNADLPATVSAYKLDQFEITVGRVRTFLNAFGGDLRGSLNLPPGAGAHPRIAGSGWRSSFAIRLPGSMQEATERFTTACAYGGVIDQGGAPTWTDAPGSNEDKPMNCIDWYTLFALCAWDGGRLPTDAEWGFAAEGGSENRTFAWGNWEAHYPADIDLVAAGITDPSDNYERKMTVGTPYATLTDGPSHIAQVGKKTGVGRWGHADLSGNMIEFMLDYGELLPGNCVDCANVAWPDPPQEAGHPITWRVLDSTGSWVNGATQPDGGRILRGGSWNPEHPVGNYYNHGNYPVWRNYFAAGARCARD